MNQILDTKIANRKNNKLIKKTLKFQFYSSIIIIIIIICFILYNNFALSQKEKYSSEILNNYNITKLYSNTSSSKSLDSNTYLDESYVIGIIEIPKISIYYPIFSTCTDELLKISPCKIYGTQPGKTGNLCIAGHNYDNDKFFSKIANLNIDDEIILYNNRNKEFSYFVTDIYEVRSDDLSPVYSYDKKSKLLTLITCNNLNNNRIIVRASYI